jgi:hypothetical protein
MVISGRQNSALLKEDQGGSRMPSIIEVAHGGGEADPLNETIHQTIGIEPFTLVLGVLSGIVVGSLLWYFGLSG